MILTCPACTMRYLVSKGAIGPEGRRVRCAHCGNQWFQDPETGLDEALFAAEPDIDMFHSPRPEEEDAPFEHTPTHDDLDEEAGADFQSILQKQLETAPIPEGVKPIHVHEDITLPAQGQKKAGRIPTRKIGGYATAAIVWALVLGIVLVMHPHISRAWPASNLLYSMVGLKPVPPGEGLSLDTLRAELADGRIHMSGEIINLKETELPVPAIMAAIVDKDGKEIDSILIPPPVARLRAEGRVPFDGLFPKIPDGAANVNYAFSFVKVKAVKEELEEAPHDPAAPPGHVPTEEGHAEEAPQNPAPHH